MKISQRLTAGLAVALAVTALAGSPAVAAPPTNDVFGGAEIVAGLPFTALLDTTEATTDADDAELNAGCGAPATDASVWYSLTAAADESYLADVSASDYTAGVIVATGSPGGFEVIACGPGGAAWQATAGETYLVVVFDDQFDEGGNGGQMELAIDVAPPAPALEVTVDPTARFDAKTGWVTLSGTIMCGADAEFAFLDAQLTQRVGRFLIRGWGGAEITCDGTTNPWAIEMMGDNGLFKGGKSATVTFAVACGVAFCSDYMNETTVQLRGKR
ncbi:DUF6299 family protein [Microbacterium aureliae]